jgi:hypothetical protein
VVSRPPAVRRKPKASNEAPTYKSVMVALAQGIFFQTQAEGSDISILDALVIFFLTIAILIKTIVI